MKRLAISQSNYIPWKGYFDMISRVDEFVLYDDMQFTRRDWRNRNQIKTAQGPHWLTIPVESKGNYYEAIKNIRVSNKDWAEAHWKTIKLSYSRAPHFAAYAPQIEALYQAAAQEELLSRINYLFLTGLCQILSISTPIKWSMDFELPEGRNERLVSICKQAGASVYLSGPAAKDYMDESLFQAEGIAVEWMDYSGYEPYEQRFGDFTHALSVLDVIFNCGPAAAALVTRRKAE